ncbi:hypothetical protein GEMRC1_001372 [Eukaryota sp. GEM-RC1]
MSSQSGPLLDDRKAIVMDNGTGYSKLGYAGQSVPNFIIPSAVGHKLNKRSEKGKPFSDLDILIGDQAVAEARTYDVEYPLKHGQIENWDMMEKLWHHSMFDYLRCSPEEHNFLLTEPPLNSPENREYTAEIMFETFGVKGLHIGVQAVLALYGSIPADSGAVTGTVIDSGDGVTHIIPVVEGYVVGSAIKHIPPSRSRHHSIHC